jgi:hypothetical protein
VSARGCPQFLLMVRSCPSSLNMNLPMWLIASSKLHTPKWVVESQMHLGKYKKNTTGTKKE